MFPELLVSAFLESKSMHGSSKESLLVNIFVNRTYCQYVLKFLQLPKL